MTVKPNDLIAGYHFVQKLGDGGTGTVWLAREKDTHLLVAIKVLRTELFPPSSAQMMYERVVASITSIGRLTHPNLVDTRTTFHQPRLGLYGIVSEYLEGQTLDGIYIPKAVDGRPGASDPRTMAGVLSWFQQIATVLAWLHANGVVHGNVRPRNVMLMTGYERPTIKLLDLCWSNARIVGGAPLDQRFVSPEQIAGGEPTPASDQWAAAKLLHQLLISSAPPGSQTQALSTAPIALLRIVQRALQKDPRERFPDAGGFYYALESVKSQLEQQAGVRGSWDADKRLSETAPVESVPPAQAPRGTVGDPTERVMFESPAEPKDDVAVPAANPRKAKSPVQVTREVNFESPRPTSGDPLGVDELFEPSDPPLIAPPQKERSRRQLEREVTDAVEAFDDDERPPRNWMPIVGLCAIVLAIAIISGAYYWTTSRPEITIVDRRDAGVLSGEGKKPPDPTEAKAGSSSIARAPVRPEKTAPTPAKTSSVTVPLKKPPVSAHEADGEGELSALETECHAKKAAACTELGDRYVGGKGVAKNPTQAAAAYEHACDLGRTSACSKAGEQLLKDGSPAAAKNARRVLEKACDRQVSSACAELARLYAEGIGGAQNDRVAKAFRARACGYGLKSSCDN
jgi:serine/threonine protein kinase